MEAPPEPQLPPPPVFSQLDSPLRRIFSDGYVSGLAFAVRRQIQVSDGKCTVSSTLYDDAATVGTAVRNPEPKKPSPAPPAEASTQSWSQRFHSIIDSTEWPAGSRSLPDLTMEFTNRIVLSSMFHPTTNLLDDLGLNALEEAFRGELE